MNICIWIWLMFTKNMHEKQEYHLLRTLGVGIMFKLPIKSPASPVSRKSPQNHSYQAGFMGISPQSNLQWIISSRQLPTRAIFVELSRRSYLHKLVLNGGTCPGNSHISTDRGLIISPTYSREFPGGVYFFNISFTTEFLSSTGSTRGFVPSRVHKRVFPVE